jgi:hypothetical protein
MWISTLQQRAIALCFAAFLGILSVMRLLVDSDIFCKLGVGNLLSEALAVFGASVTDCGRLPALPHMLRKGKLLRVYGAEACTSLVPLAEKMQTIPVPDTTWLDRLTLVQAIDPGEAQLFAIAAQNTLSLITGDKRALRALKDINGYAEALTGRIIVLEAILLALCDRLGHAEVRRRLGPLTTADKTLMICFSEGNPDPRSALVAYYRSLATEVHPLLLWEPHTGGPA